MIKLEHNDKLGMYYVGSYPRPIHNKLMALELAEKTNSTVRWNFNDSVFDTVKWTECPETSIDTLYYMRALQLREKYDVIVLNFSGGSDSTNILNTFLKNNLHIDEIIVRHPETGLKNVSATDTNIDSTNQISEFEYAVLPKLRWVKDNFPNVKITIHDYFESMVSENIDSNWIYAAREFFHPGVIKRYSNLSMRSQLSMYDKGKTVGVVYGIDKPRMIFDNGKYYAYFLDVNANTVVSEVADYPNITTELFYWTPDLPELYIKQVHLVKQFFEQHPQYLNLISPTNKLDEQLFTMLEREVLAPAIYPSTDLTMFQGNKIGNAILSPHDSWFWNNHMDTGIAKTWKAGIDELVKKVPSFITYDAQKNVSGLTRFTSKFYQLN